MAGRFAKFYITKCNEANLHNPEPTEWITCQFGAFLFGAHQFDACQFGALHFDAVPVRRVSVWRDASLARFTLARFPFLCLTAQKCFLRQFGTYLVLRLC